MTNDQQQLNTLGARVTLADGRTAEVVDLHRSPSGRVVVTLWTDQRQTICKPLRLIKLAS